MNREEKKTGDQVDGMSSSERRIMAVSGTSTEDVSFSLTENRA